MPRDRKKDPRWRMEEKRCVREYEYRENKSTTLQKITKNMQIKIIREEDDELEFDIINCPHVPLVNAFRRILLSDVPSMAIEKVYIVNNTSLVQDEILAHRLGLIPLRADARLFEFPRENKKENEIDDQDTLRYELKIMCSRNPGKLSIQQDAYKNDKVYSKDIKWIPIGEQANMYPHGAEQFGTIHQDILIAKLLPGHEIHVFMHAIKSTGRDHAKFSPVALATFRLMPDIEILKPIRNENADLLQKVFSPGVIDVVEKQTNSGEKYREARVANPRFDACNRNVFEYKELAESVELTRKPNHFIFTVESVGALPSAVLFTEAVKVLKSKCRTFLAELETVSK